AGMVMEALFLFAVPHAFRGEFAEVDEVCDRALRDYDNRERTRFWATITGEDSGVAHRCYKAVALWHLGRGRQSLQLIEEAVSLARSIGQPFTLAFALEHRAWLSLHCRLPELTLETVREEISVATEQGYSYWLASARLFEADALVQKGESARAIPLLHTGIE